MINDSKILVVDDDASLLDLISQVLTLNGMSCDMAGDGLQAFSMLQNKFYSLIISDIRMPNMTGTELLQAVRNYQLNKNEKSKVILMTAYSTGEILENIDALGVDDFLTKPFDISFFINRVNIALETK